MFFIDTNQTNLDVHPPGLEPGTVGLKGHCSAN